jgi:hypothetical protein
METHNYGSDPVYSGTTGSTGATGELKGQVSQQVSQMKDQARSRAVDTIEEGKDKLCEALDQIASALDQGNNRVGGIAADYARRGCEYLRGRSANELWSTAGQTVRGRPGALVAASFLGGFAISRLLRR